MASLHRCGLVMGRAFQVLPVTALLLGMDMALPLATVPTDHRRAMALLGQHAQVMAWARQDMVHRAHMVHRALMAHLLAWDRSEEDTEWDRPKACRHHKEAEGHMVARAVPAVEVALGGGKSDIELCHSHCSANCRCVFTIGPQVGAVPVLQGLQFGSMAVRVACLYARCIK